MVKVRDTHPVLSDGSVDIHRWLERVEHNRHQHQLIFIRQACELAERYGHDVQTPFQVTCFHHGLMMAEIVDELGLDENCVAASLIYEASRFGKLSASEISKYLGEDVRSLVEGLNKINEVCHQGGALETPQLNHKNFDNLRRMLLAVVDDIRVVLLKLAQQTCEMRAVIPLSDEQRRQLAFETSEIYAPLANRLGIGQLKWELEDLSFRFIEPAAYKTIAKLLDERRVDRERYIERVKTAIKEALIEQSITAEISGRVKHIYSIWRKMLRKMVSYHEIYDVRAIRVIVPELKDCYATLGVVHGLWKHIPKEFDDYIANPKGNGYQSLHTAVVGPEGRVLEIQIRTRTMHEQAELGVAAHWRYKEGGEHEPTYDEKLASLRQLLNWQEQVPEDEGSFDNMRAELFNDRVYVFTPTGDVVSLPQGATALDFAYNIHTDIGHRCRGAKVNGKIVPLTQALKNGSQVEILTAKEGGPSRDWLNSSLKYLKTSRARVKVQQWFKHQDREDNIQNGREIVTRELKRLGFDNISIDKIANEFSTCKTSDDFLALVGVGDIRLSQVLGALQRIIPKEEENEPKSFLQQRPPRKANRPAKEAEITVQGIGNLLCHMAKCCKPVPGDDIIGYITVGSGISVHRKDCPNVLQASDEKQNRLIEVNWGSETINLYRVDVEIHAFDRRGLLRDITAVLASEKVNVIAITTLSDDDKSTAVFRFTLEVSGIESLGKVLARILQVQNVTDVFRVNQ